MKLVDLVPINEGSMQARELADRNSLQQLQAMYDQLMRDMEQEAEPEGGPIADMYGQQMQDIEDAMQMKRGKTKDVPYDVAIGRMTQDEYDRAIGLKEGMPTSISDEDLDELLNIILKYVKDPDDAQAELDRFDQGGFDALSNMVAANLDRDPEYKAWYNKLHSIKESVDISYTDPGFRFYKMKVDGKRLNREEGTEYLKGLGIDMEIPRSYNETTLDKIVDKLKEKGIDADHDAAMDVS